MRMQPERASKLLAIFVGIEHASSAWHEDDDERLLAKDFFRNQGGAIVNETYTITLIARPGAFDDVRWHAHVVYAGPFGVTYETLVGANPAAALARAAAWVEERNGRDASIHNAGGK